MKRAKDSPERLPAHHLQMLPGPARATPEQLQQEVRFASHSPIVDAVLKVTDANLVVLNAQRQIVAFNSQMAALRQPAEPVGLRLGDWLKCVEARAEDGCGTSPGCTSCGALGAVLTCQQRAHSVEAECLLRTDLPGHASVEFNVRATPVLLDGHRFVVLSLRDISAEKRRQALEEIFFHDVLNTVSGLRGWIELLRRRQGEHPRAAAQIELLSRHLEHELRDHRALSQAEQGTLVPRPEKVQVAELLRDLEATVTAHTAARGRTLELEGVVDLEIEADPTLLLRVLINMTRNAFEATPTGGVVRLWVEPRDAADTVLFSVHNSAFIPAVVQNRVFQRSFSTKAPNGRGLGTYSMKLLGERCLGGVVSFTSDPESGTTFFLDLPRRAAARAGGEAQAQASR